MKKKKYRLYGGISEYSFDQFNAFINECYAEMPEEPEKEPEKLVEIEIEINSPGGDVISGNSMIGLMYDYPGQKTGRIEGICASMASIFAVCSFKPENLKMRENAIFLTHGARFFAFGEMTEEKLKEQQKMIEVINNNFCKALMQRTGLTEDECKNKFLKGDNTFSAAECKELGLIGEILPAVVNVHVPSFAANADSLNDLCNEFNSKLTSMENTAKEPEVKDVNISAQTTVSTQSGESDLKGAIRVLEERVQAQNVLLENERKRNTEFAQKNVELEAANKNISAESSALIEAQKIELTAKDKEIALLRESLRNTESRMRVEREFSAINQSNGIVLTADNIAKLTNDFLSMNKVEIAADVVKIYSITSGKYIENASLKDICADFARYQLPSLFSIQKGNGFNSNLNVKTTTEKTEEDLQSEVDRFNAEWKKNNPHKNLIGSTAHNAALNEFMKSLKA